MLKILIADDDYFARYGLRESIPWEDYGYSIVAEAIDANDAYDKYMEHKPDIVITDICMEETNGLDFITRVNSMVEVPAEFVVLTGFAEFEYVKKALENRVYSYLLKPVKNDELLAKLDEIKKKITDKRYREEIITQLQSTLPYNQNSYLIDILTGKIPITPNMLEKTTDINSSYQQEVRQAISIITRDYASPLTVSQVSNEVFISPSHLMFIFRRDTGKSFNEFLTEYRLNIAIKMLKSNQYKIYEIAEKVGYKNSKYFTQIFKKYLNSTPTDYLDGGL